MKMPTLDKFPKKVLAKIDIQRAFIIARIVVAAERLQVFRLLQDKHMKADAIGRALKIHKFYLKAFLDSLVALGLLHKSNDSYWNSPLAKLYFIKERSIFWTRQYSKECVHAYEALTVLEEALRSGKRYESIKRLKKTSYIDAMKRDPHLAEDFTQMLFHFHQDDAKELANRLDLSNRRALLDVGGGSGVMSIALAKKNRGLRASIFDIAQVCEIAARNIRRAGLSKRIGTIAGDIRDGLPTGYDVMMLCDIGRVSKQILRRAHRSLAGNGLIVLVDRYLSKDGTSPLDRLTSHFAGSSFGLATWADMVAELTTCGFHSVNARNAYRDVWIITGIKAVGNM